jgi:23S rRNA pseudouridine2605 synthase
MPRPPRREPAPKSAPKAAPKAAASGERVAKVLARAGLASRREAEAIIAAGRVEVNGKRIDSPALNVRATDRILVDGKPLAAPQPPRLWLYHKPLGLVTSARDEKGRATVFDRLPEGMPRVMPVGRLDINSEGLLLLTNDGEVKRKLELPATGWLRKYRVRVNGKPDDARFEPLRKGITVEGERFQPMQVSLDRQQGANAWLTVGIREGRNREVRRAMEAVGLIVNRLIRTGYGPFQLGDLAAGAVEEVRPRILRDQLGIEVASEESAPKPARRPAAAGAAKSRPKTASAGVANARPEGSGKPAKSAGKPRSRAGERPVGKPAGKTPGAGPGAGSGASSAGRAPRSRDTKRHGRTTPSGAPRQTGPRR